MLAHLLGHASYAHSRRSGQYVVDAILLLRKYPLDWRVVADTIERSRTALPAATQLDYLRRAFGADIPSSVLERLEKSARETPGAYVEAAIDGARRGKTASLGDLIRGADTGLARRALLKWALAPSPELLLWQGKIAAKGQAGGYRFVRPFKYLARLSGGDR